jgi:hypothetical protein
VQVFQDVRRGRFTDICPGEALSFLQERLDSVAHRREAPLQTCAAEVLWRRPKDLASSTWGLDQCREASPAMAGTRSFSRAQTLDWLTVTGVRSIRESNLGHPKIISDSDS